MSKEYLRVWVGDGKISRAGCSGSQRVGCGLPVGSIAISGTAFFGGVPLQRGRFGAEQFDAEGGGYFVGDGIERAGGGGCENKGDVYQSAARAAQKGGFLFLETKSRLLRKLVVKDGGLGWDVGDEVIPRMRRRTTNFRSIFRQRWIFRRVQSGCSRCRWERRGRS